MIGDHQMNILISGTPGTGKTEISDILGNKTGMGVIHVSDLVDKFAVGIDEKRNSKEIDEEKLSEYLSRFDNVIIDTHLPIKINAKCIVLKCDIKELGKRLKQRKWSEKKIEENLQAEIFGECEDDLSEDYEIIKIDTTGRTAENVAKEIKNILKL